MKTLVSYLHKLDLDEAFKGVSIVEPKRLVPLMAKTNNMTVKVYEKEDPTVSLAKYVADLSNKFTSTRGAFTILLVWWLFD
ncbi:6-phosphogluconolactonase 4 [Spatholobus suberectus]|nr:6-phosphogluconolactonase 4 [Spatholobus suberectus]